MGNRVSQLQFDAASHRYTLDGGDVPSVTTILSGSGVTHFGGPKGPDAEAAMLRGRLVHQGCEDYDNGALDMAAVREDCIPYVQAYIKFVADTGFAPMLIEAKVLAEKHGYCGTLDRFGELQGIDTLIDLKTGSCGRSAGPQTAAYAYAALESYGVEAKRRFALVLTPSGYKLEPLTDAQDWKVFLAALTVHHFKARTQ